MTLFLLQKPQEQQSRPIFTADELFTQAFTGDAENVVEYSLVANEKESIIELPDGNTLMLNTWLYNKELAGNTLRVKLGDRIKVTFQNNLNEPSTIHWYGVRLPKNMDGVPEISHDLMHDGRWGQLVTVNGKVGPNYTLAPGTRVRLRLINTANGRVFKPVSEAPWEVVAMDGMNIPEPQLLSELQLTLSPGDRIDLELNITDEHQGISLIDEYVSGYSNTLATFSLAESLESDSELHSAVPVILPD